MIRILEHALEINLQPATPCVYYPDSTKWRCHSGPFSNLRGYLVPSDAFLCFLRRL
jgi:hypothetical protein